MKKFIFSLLFLFAVAATEGNAQGWTQKANISDMIGRQGSVSFTIGNYIYVFGGGTLPSDTVASKKLMRYDPLADVWDATLAPFPGLARAYPAVFVINNKAYVCFGGGLSAGDGKYADMYCYDPATDSWTLIAFATHPSARDGAAYFVIGNKGYLIGGQDPSYVIINDVWEFDPAIGWIQKNPLPSTIQPRAVATAFAIGAIGYVCTGWNGAMGGLNDCFSYDPVNDSCTVIAPFLGAARGNNVSFVIGGKAIVGSGSVAGCFFFRDFWLFSPSTTGGSWTQVASMSDSKIGATGASCNGRGYVFMGSDSLIVPMIDTWEYDPGVTTGTIELLVTVVAAKAYPNPAVGSMTLEVPSDGLYSITIFDAACRSVLEETTDSGSITIELVSGIYTCVIKPVKVESAVLPKALILEFQ